MHGSGTCRPRHSYDGHAKTNDGMSALLFSKTLQGALGTEPNIALAPYFVCVTLPY